MGEGKQTIWRVFGLFLGLNLAFLSSFGLAQAALRDLPDLNQAHEKTGLSGPLGLEGLAYEIEAAPGFEDQEALFLQARLKADGGLITRAIQWNVSRVNEIGGLEPGITGESAAFALPAKPGLYRVDIFYGLASLTQFVQLPPGEQRTLTFILDVGGLRVLSRLENLVMPPETAMVHRIFAEDGPNRGRLIAQTRAPGEMLRLLSGSYRIESEIGPGNALAETHVQIKPGILSTLEIGHKAGLARFSLSNSDAAWTVRDFAGRAIATIGKNVRELILSPGTYRVERGQGLARKVTAFTIAPGQSLGVSLPE